MSLTDWIARTFGSMEGLVAVLLAAAIFIGLYIYSASRLHQARLEAIDRIRQSLSLYTRLAGALDDRMNGGSSGPLVNESLTALVQECKAADRLTIDLQEHLDTFLRDQDESRLGMLHRALEREMNRLIEERTEIIRRVESPGWGMGLWLLLKPAVPAIALGAAIVWTAEMVIRLREPSAWLMPEVWSLWLTSMIATVSFYRLLMDGKRKSSGIIIHMLHLLIAAAALPGWIWLEAAPYVLILQLLLYLAGFRFTAKRRRRERPYAGHPDMMKQLPAAPEAMAMDEAASPEPGPNTRS
ncbi:hypothetical protein MKX64_07315 [Paenibacillus sp. FSL M8-0334]|uniref:hypothetical protein n=1 Tax=Paenibacillus sp. FSL M8-0334 TaxID=2921623 RepID=UPI0030F8E208